MTKYTEECLLRKIEYLYKEIDTKDKHIAELEAALKEANQTIYDIYLRG